MRFRPAAVLALSCILPLVAGCKHPAPNSRSARLPTGSIQGVVTFSGTLPKPSAADLAQAQACAERQKTQWQRLHPHLTQDHMLPRTLPPVFVWISAGFKYAPYTSPRHQTVLTQLGCRFHPQLLGVLTGKPVTFTNSDRFPAPLHVAPRVPGNPSLNLTLKPRKPGQTRSFPHPEFLIPVTSPGRHWMRAYINVVPNPYFTVSGPEGHFLLPNLQAGVYTLSALRPGYPVQSQTITIKDKSVTQITFTFPAAKTPPPGKTQ